jgi:cell wall-associated NlpC family hydrolase
MVARQRTGNSWQWRLVGVCGVLFGLLQVIGAEGARPASADPLSSAQARAAALSARVDALQTRAEVATQAYDALRERLAVAVEQQVSADRLLTRQEATFSRAQNQLTSGIRALYEGEGGLEAAAALLAGNPNQAADQARLASAAFAYQQNVVQSALATVESTERAEAHDAVITRSVVGLQQSSARTASRITALLNEQRTALASASATVRRLMRAKQRADAAASHRDFVAAVQQSGGQVNAAPSGSRPPNKVAAAAAAIAAARTRLGLPYVWGATGPNSFDCSGLTQWAYARAGITLSRVAADQWNNGPHPALADLLPGDLLFWATDVHDPRTIEHEAMYIGRGLMVVAPHTGTNIQIEPVYYTGYIGATRPWA